MKELQKFLKIVFKGQASSILKMEDYQLDEEISEFPWNPEDRNQQFEKDAEGNIGVSTKGTKKLPEQWTRVISIYGDDLT